MVYYNNITLWIVRQKQKTSNHPNYISFYISIFRSQEDEQQTEPPPRGNFSDTANQWIIYDAYVNYELQKDRVEDEVKRAVKKAEAKVSFKKSFKKAVVSVQNRIEKDKSFTRLLGLGQNKVDEKEETNKRLLKSAKTLERMVSQELSKDIALGLVLYVMRKTLLNILASNLKYVCTNQG